MPGPLSLPRAANEWKIKIFVETVLNRGAENAGVENARVENAGAITYGKPPEETRSSADADNALDANEAVPNK